MVNESNYSWVVCILDSKKVRILWVKFKHDLFANMYEFGPSWTRLQTYAIEPSNRITHENICKYACEHYFDYFFVVVLS